MSQVILQDSALSLEALDMTAGLYGMQSELGIRPGVNVDLSIHRRKNVRADFRHLPFRDNSFRTILWDPPHLIRSRFEEQAVFDDVSGLGPGYNTWKYGVYPNVQALQKSLYLGYREASRLLVESGQLIFKWSDAAKSLTWAIDLRPRTLKIIHCKVRKSRANTVNKHSVFYVKMAKVEHSRLID